MMQQNVTCSDKILLIVYKAVNGLSPLYISNLLSFYTPSRNLRSNEKLLLIEPKSKHSWGDRSFGCCCTMAME